MSTWASALHCHPEDLWFRERVRVGRNGALARDHTRCGLKPLQPAWGGQPASEVPTPSLWRQQAGWEGWWEPESSGLEGTGA